MERLVLSLIVPVYKNADTSVELVEAIAALDRHFEGDFEAVFVIDGLPTDAAVFLSLLPTASFRSRLIVLSRNFGSFAAIRAGLEQARGQYFAVMSADLQEPPDAIQKIGKLLISGECDVVIGIRTQRDDFFLSTLFANIFWSLYKRFVNASIPAGGVDIFGCNAAVRKHLVELSVLNSSLIGLLFWVGFRRCEVPYIRQRRLHGKSAWTFRRKWRYLSDSIYSFSDLPIRLVGLAGAAGMVTAVILASVVTYAKLQHMVPIPGYTATVLTIMFFGGLNAFAIGILGGYIWRTFENTKSRPSSIVMEEHSFGDSRTEQTPARKSGTTTLQRVP
jgi:glycosyltransferase involved in cell wall biosynthesis